MEEKKAVPTLCRQCRKDINTELIVCIPCDKSFHPSCHKQHKTYNSYSELVPCKGKFEIFTQKGGSMEGGSGDKDKKRECVDSGSALRPVGAERTDLTKQTRDSMDDKIENIYELIKEIKDEIIGKVMIKNIIKNIIKETMEEEMSKIRVQLQQ